MTLHPVHIALPTEDATATLAASIAPRLASGDVILLEGPIGAGKSAFARALIRARLGRMEDVPSPTFTLVQTYDDPHGDLWHCDLYRLGDPDEALELGVDEAFTTAICLIEWPGRLGTLVPDGALKMQFTADTSAHSVTIEMTPKWQEKLGLLHV